jgi:hypothetical protein
MVVRGHTTAFFQATVLELLDGLKIERATLIGQSSGWPW